MTPSTEPLHLICIDCQKPFAVSEEEQRFYQQRSFRRPVRCLDCRAAHRASRNDDLVHHAESDGSWTETLGHYGGVTGNTRGGARRNGGGFPAICAACGKETVVPFEPRSGRPVYCRECFTANKRSR